MKRLIAIIFLLAADIFLLAPPLLAQWEPDVRLTFNNNSNCTSRNNAKCITASGDTVHAVWYGFTSSKVYYIRSTDGGTTWGRDTSFCNSSKNPGISSSGSMVLAVWEDQRGGPCTKISYGRSTNGGTNWEMSPLPISDSAFAANPSVAVIDSFVHVAWNDSREGSCEIYYKRSTDRGITWGPDVRLTTFDSLCSHGPAVTAWGANVHLVWFDSRDSNWEVYYKRSTDRGRSWEPDARLSCHPDTSVFATIAVSDSNIHVVWRDHRDGNNEIYYTRSTNGGSIWEPETRLTCDSALPDYPSLAASGPNVHLCWPFGWNGQHAGIYYKHSSDRGATWGPDTPLTNSRHIPTVPSLITSGPKLHLLWCDDRDGNYQVYYKRNLTGNSGTETAGDRGQRLEVRIKAIPNPFSSFATVPGHSSSRFALYDVSGRRVGTYKGDRIGEGLRAGVYFMRANEGKGKLARIVKVR